MAVRESTPRRGDRRHVWLAAAVLGLLAAWAVISAARRPEPSPASHPAREAAPTRALATPLVDAPAPPTPARAPELAADGVPIKPSDPAAPVPSGPVHPHPITPTHERIYRENTLLGALNGAMDVKDAPGLRRLLAEYRDEYPEDEHALQRGYEIIADCLDHPGDASTSAAHRYYDTETASTLRRYVRRYCFE